MNLDYRPLALNLVFLKVDFLKCNIRYLVTVERRPSSQKICLLLQQHYVGQQNKTFANFPKLRPAIIDSSYNKNNLVDDKESDRGDYSALLPNSTLHRKYTITFSTKTNLSSVKS